MSLNIKREPRPFVTLLAFILVFLVIAASIQFFGYFWVMLIPNLFLVILTITLLVAYFDNKEEAIKPLEKAPALSVIIPAYNVKDSVLGCINAIKASKYPGQMEIIVVDDGSTDGTRELLKKIEGVHALFKEKNAGKAAAINSGAKIAKGDVIACVDSDSYPVPEAFHYAVSALLRDERNGAATCFIRVANPGNNLLKRIQDIEYLTGFGFSQITTKFIDAIFVAPGPMSIFRKKVFLEIGGFDEQNITEDLEIAWRLKKYGYKIDYSPEAVVYTEVPGDLKTLYRQRMRWYRGKLFNIRKYSDMMFNKKYGVFGMFILPFSFSAELSGTVLSFSFLYLVTHQLIWTMQYLLSNLELGAMLIDLKSMVVVGSSMLAVGFVLVLPWFLTVYLSHKIANKKVGFHDLLATTLFLMFYGSVISFFYCISLFKEINRSDYRWK
ncbi:MAG: glycosyltransferase [Candidatus Micrarchaeia archaeon]